MNARQLTDAQVAEALRAWIPDRAQAGLRARVLDAAGSTAQQRPLPSFLGALTDADPVARRGSLLIAAVLLLALLLASAAAVGALRLLEPDPVQDLSLEPPADLPAFVLSSYERLPQLPPLALAWHEDDSAKGRVYVDRSGAVRFDRFTSAEATEPSSYTVLSGSRMSGMALVGSEAVWVEADGVIGGEDPRVFLRTVLPNTYEWPGCEMEGNGSAATGWRWVGVEYVAGRPTHHVACAGDRSLDIDLWLDIETRLILRTRGPLADDEGQPVAGQFRTREVTEIAFGEQPAALFEPPEGVARMPNDAYDAYVCARDLPNEEVVGLGIRDCSTPPEAEATALPTPTPMPTVRPSVGPRPSGSAGPLAWTQASLKEDWPAPVRAEPAGSSILVPILVQEGVPGVHLDPSGDIESAVFPWVDIREVRLSTAPFLSIHPVSSPPRVDPTEQWIAYGVVFDEDRNGVPDWRYGMDNRPVANDDNQGVRAWRTDLHTGRTETAPPYYNGVAGVVLDTYWDYNDMGATFVFGGEVAGGGAAGKRMDVPFYVWASVIQDGRVVATDYAPDAGWLDPSPDAKP